MKQEVATGQQDYTVLVLIRNTEGAPEPGLVAADITAAYAIVELDNDVTTASTAMTALSALTDAHTNWGFLEVNATTHPGLYRLDLADAVFASLAWSAVVSLTGTGLDPTHLEFSMVPVRPYDGVNVFLAGGTAWTSGAVSAAVLSTAAVEKVADAVLNRATSNVETSVVPKSLGAAVMKLTHRVADNGAGSLVVYKSNGTTPAYSQVITSTDAGLVAIEDLAGAS